MDLSEKDLNEVPQDELQEKQSKDGGRDLAQEMNDAVMTEVQIQIQDGSTPVTPEKSSQEPNSGVHISRFDKGSISSVTPRGVAGTPGSASIPFEAGLEGRNLFMREKVLEDGYNWRKYGQKFVKGNEFIRSYYRCTYPGCQVKKQLEHSHDGKILDIVYLNEHEHPKPQLRVPVAVPQHNVPAAVGFVLSIVDAKTEESSGKITRAEYRPQPTSRSTSASQISTVTSTEDVNKVQPELNRIQDEDSNNEDPPLKRQKNESPSTDHGPKDKHGGESCHVVQTESAVDSVNDGYRWRKYGQKMVKGHANPRSYYRCSSPGCAAKKQVERASHDPKLVITTYEGKHDHDKPNSRTFMPDANASDRSQNGGSCSKSGEHYVKSPIKIVNKDSNSNRRQTQVKCKPETDDEGNNAARPSMLVRSISPREYKLIEQQNKKSGSTKESDTTGHNKTPHVSSKHRSNDILGKPRTELKERNSACSIHSINQGPENNLKEPYTPKSEPVQS